MDTHFFICPKHFSLPCMLLFILLSFGNFTEKNSLLLRFISSVFFGTNYIEKKKKLDYIGYWWRWNIVTQLRIWCIHFGLVNISIYIKKMVSFLYKGINKPRKSVRNKELNAEISCNMRRYRPVNLGQFFHRLREYLNKGNLVLS